MNTGIGGVIAKSALETEISWTHVDAEPCFVVGKQSAFGQVETSCSVVKNHGGSIEVGTSVDAESSVGLSEVVHALGTERNAHVG